MKGKGEIEVWEAVRDSFGIILHNPIILLPMLAVSLFGLFANSVRETFMLYPIPSFPSIIKLLGFNSLFLFLSLLIYVFMEGMYPLMVKNVLETKEIEIGAAFGCAVRKSLSLIVAGIFVFLLIGIGIIFFIIPGVVLAIWYFYTIPVIMLEDRGVLEGMSASKAFARDKMFDTFLLFLIPAVIVFLMGVFSLPLRLFVPAAEEIVNFILSLVVSTWMSVIPAYVYIKYKEEG